MPKQSEAALKLKRLRERADLTVRAVADAVGMPPSTYASYEDKFKKPYLPIDLVKKLAPVFSEHGIDIEETLDLAGMNIARGMPVGARKTQFKRESTAQRPRTIANQLLGDSILIEELDVRGGAGGNGAHEPRTEVDEGRLVERIEPITEWQLPAEVVRPVSRAPAEKIKIITIVGESMEPDFRPGQKVMVDTTDITPSPPGVFAVWDGLGIVVKQVEFVPFSDPPRVRISSKNPDYSPYERVLSEAYIQGRVIATVKWV